MDAAAKWIEGEPKVRVRRSAMRSVVCGLKVMGSAEFLMKAGALSHLRLPERNELALHDFHGTDTGKVDVVE
ncbi:MAG: hypothetical protein ACI8Z1_000458 [Candidatus Azotimanducaceae bacterium]